VQRKRPSSLFPSQTAKASFLAPDTLHDTWKCSSVSIKCTSEHRIPDDHRVLAKPILGGVHHEYRLATVIGMEMCAAWAGALGRKGIERKAMGNAAATAAGIQHPRRDDQSSCKPNRRRSALPAKQCPLQTSHSDVRATRGVISKSLRPTALVDELASMSDPLFQLVVDRRGFFIV